MNIFTEKDWVDATYHIDGKPYETLAVAIKKWKKMYATPQKWKEAWITSEKHEALLIKIVYERW